MKMKFKYNPYNIYSYLLGNFRYKLYYKYPRFKFLVPGYVWEQIEARIKSMDKECYNNGECKICGCKTTALQMANKACDKPCYPRMLNKSRWEFIKNNNIIYDIITKKFWKLKNNKFKKVKSNNVKLYVEK